jgi:hypothetical protein
MMSNALKPPMLAVLVTLALVVACRPPQVEITNDTGEDVSLKACSFLNPYEIKRGKTREIHPTRACSVYAEDRYLGCLVISRDEVEDGRPLTIEGRLEDMPQGQCAGTRIR